MRVVHYSLGFPPFRRGGMTTYCIDLISEQIARGYGVSLLWPGRLLMFGSSCSIRMRSPYDSPVGDQIASYELVNPLPVPLMNGIRNAEWFTIPKDKSVFIEFFRRLRADVFHVHTLQGLPQEALDACLDLGVKTIFTTHDFFGLCPMVSLKKPSGLCIDDHNCSDCYQCNANALSKPMLKVVQSGTYRRFKDSSLVRELRQRNNGMIGGSISGVSDSLDIVGSGAQQAWMYRSLRAYYKRAFESFDVILANSSLTLRTYLRYVVPKDSRVLNPTHRAVYDRRSVHAAHKVLRLGYLGPRMEAKGYFVLRDACDRIAEIRPGEFELRVHFQDENRERDYLNCGEPYTYEDLQQIAGDLDVLVVPSVSYETFGFTALEGMSFGVPAIVSANAGAADLVVDGENGLVVEPTLEGLEQAISSLVEHPERVSRMSQMICRKFEVPTIHAHSIELEKVYADLLVRQS